jgi:hypothetical protein
VRHLPSHLRYDPALDQFFNAASDHVAVPATTAEPVAFQPLEGDEALVRASFQPLPGAQTAKLALAPDTADPIAVYRYRSVLDGAYAVRIAEWDGTTWTRQVVYEGMDTYPAVALSASAAGPRVHYAKREPQIDLQAFAAERQEDGSWAEALLSPGEIERLAVTRRDSTDYVYLSAPLTHTLYYGTR